MGNLAGVAFVSEPRFVLVQFLATSTKELGDPVALLVAVHADVWWSLAALRICPVL